MSKILFTITIIFALAFMPLQINAQNEPFTIMYTVQNISSDSIATTLNLKVTVSYGGGEVANNISLKLTSPIGDDANIQGEFLFNAIESGQLKVSAGIFSAPKGFFDGSIIDSLIWKATYTDVQGQIQTSIIHGIKH
jgi:hypothetical protein